MKLQSWQALESPRQNALVTLVVDNMAPYVADDPESMKAFAVQKRAEMSAKDALFIISRDHDAKIFGFAQIAQSDSSFGKIVFVSELQIRPTYQSQGRGSALLAEILAFATDIQADAVMLSCNSANQRALSFYCDRHGFMVMGRDAPGLWRAAQCQLMRFTNGLDLF